MPAAGAPPRLYDQVRMDLGAKLHPSLRSVLQKLAGIYMVSGFLVLLVCPQFGLTVAAEYGLLRVFSLFGPYPCMALCGALFLGTGSYAASLILLPEELRRIRSSRLLYFGMYGLLALAVFWALGAEIALSLGSVWLLGSVLGENLAYEIGCRLRFGANW